VSLPKTTPHENHAGRANAAIGVSVLPQRVAVGLFRRHELPSRRKPRALWRLALEDGELMQEGENIRFAFKTRATRGPEGREQSDEQS